MSKFNPSEPVTLGLEWRARETVTDPVDYGQELGIRVTPTVTQTVTGASFYEAGPAAEGSESVFSSWHLATIYQDGQERNYGEVRTVTMSVSSAATTGGVLTGAATTLEAVQFPVDSKYVTIDATDTVDVTFAAPVWQTSLPRILDVTFNAVMSSATTGTSVGYFIWRPSGNLIAQISVTPGGADGDAYQVDTGEIYLGAYGFSPANDNRRRPYVKTDFDALAAGTIKLRLQNSSGSVRFHYISMTVTYCEENRVGIGGYWESTGPLAFLDPATLPWRNVMSIVHPQTAAASGVPMVSGSPYVVTVTRANDAAVDAMIRTNTGNAQWYQFGAPRLIAAVRPSDSRIVRGVQARRLSNGLLSDNFADTDRTYAISLHGPGGTTGPAYNGVVTDLTQPYAGARGTANTQFSQSMASSQTVTYQWLRAIVRRYGSPADLAITFSGGGGGSATIMGSAYLVAERDVNGWAEMLVPITGGATFTAGVSRTVSATTPGSGANRWEFLHLDAQGDPTDFNLATYGGITFIGNSSTRLDLPLTLSTSVPVVTGFAVTRGHQPLAPLSSGCPDPIIRAMDYANISWGDIPVVTGSTITGAPLTTEFSSWQVERLDQIDPVWRRIANITDRGTTFFRDYEARIGVYSDYRVRMCRDDGLCGLWNEPDGFVSFSGAAGNYVSVPDAATLTPPADFTVVVRAALDDWTPAADNTLIAHWTPSGSLRSWHFAVNTSGGLKITTSLNGTAGGSIATSIPVTVTDGAWKWVAVTVDMNNGSGNRSAEFWQSDDGVIWQSMGSDVLAGVGPLFDAATPLTLGALGDASLRLSGKISYAGLFMGRDTTPIGSGAPLFLFNGGVDLLRAAGTVTSFTTTSFHTATINTSGSPGTVAAVGGFLRLGGSVSPLSPLVTGGCDALILTSNEDPVNTVAAPLMFSGGTPTEDFAFVEAEQVVFQRLHGRDYQMAFKPLERGGSRFQRTLLLNALSVPPKRLDAFFRTLRDLAWEQLSYVCVLDARGGRWFAAVLVPDGTVREINQVYMGSIDVVETTATPSVVEVT
jgi:hypothetical protein